MKGRLIRTAVFRGVLCMAILLSLSAAFPAGAQPTDDTPDAASRQPAVGSYEAYMAGREDKRPAEPVTVPGNAYVRSGDATLTVPDELAGVARPLCWTGYKGWVEWEIDVPETGLYNLALRYLPLEGKRNDIELGLQINGAYPFTEASHFTFQRIWKDSSGIRTDASGNQYSADAVEDPEWTELDFRDADGLYNNRALCFYLEQGRQTLRLICNKETLAIDTLRLYQARALPSYEQALAGYREKGLREIPGATPVVKEAEETLRRSDQMLRPLSDRSSPRTTPYHASKIRLNYIGSTNWQYQSQWIDWEIEVPEEGLYRLGFRYQQSYVRGFFTTRRLYINGEVPFAQAENIQFHFTEKWKNAMAGGDDPYWFHLQKGSNRIRLEVVAGDISQSIRTLQDVVLELNDTYRSIIMITGTNPDPYRDYNIDAELPGMVETFNRAIATLTAERERLMALTGDRGNDTVILQTLAIQLQSILKRPASIAEKSRIENLNANISSLSSWILNIRFGPLDIDKLYVLPADAQPPRAAAGFFRQTWHEMQTFGASFFEDYNSIADDGKDRTSLTLWLNWGRDQAQVLKSIIDDSFTPSHNIGVNIKLVQASMIEAVLADKGPDLSVMVARGQPVNLAVRNALVNLKDFDDYAAVEDRFAQTAVLPYTLNGGVYGLPDTQQFQVMFVRRDILDELCIPVPQTWEELLEASVQLRRKNMMVGIPYTNIDAWGAIDQGMGTRNIFPSLLFQKGVDIYNDEHTETQLMTPEALEAFTQWTEFYTKYDYQVEFDFYNRFRTGEMPIGIASYGEYNRFSVSAPEIKGMWEMLPIPGTRQEDGAIDRSEAGSGTAAVILKRTKYVDECWTFLKWWTSADVQEQYARGMEALMGTAARQSTANVEAFGRLAWSQAELDNLMEQWQWVKEIPEVPGGYYTVRNLENAFTDVTINKRNPRETLYKWSRETNGEIRRKREEFGLDQ